MMGKTWVAVVGGAVVSWGAAVQSNAAELPAGTRLVVRMTDEVNSGENWVGQTFLGAIDEAVMMDGRAVIPRGSEVRAKLVRMKEPGRLTGRNELTLDIVSITVNGRVIHVNTDESSAAGQSPFRRSLAVFSDSDALGAVLGGAASGGNTSGAPVVIESRRLRIPKQARLEFTLQRPLEI